MGLRTPRTKRRNGLAAFRAVEAEVLDALAAGWTLVAIYEDKQARLGMSYAQFARYAQPLRKRPRVAGLMARPPETLPPSRRDRMELSVTPRDGPLKGRPEDAVRNLDMDAFATQALKRDLF